MHANADMIQVSELTWADTVSPRHIDVMPDGHRSTAQPSKAPCMKVCEQGAQSLVTDQVHGDAGVAPAPLRWIAWAVVQPHLLALHGMPDLQRTTAPPIRVRYVRLTL